MLLPRPDDRVLSSENQSVEPVADSVGPSVESGRVRRYFRELQQRQPEVHAVAMRDPFVTQCLGVVFSSSEFLSEELLRHPHWVFELGDLAQKSKDSDFAERLSKFLSAGSGSTAAELALFRRKELLRILLRDQLRIGTLSEITEELSSLADAILSCALARVSGDLKPRFGEPLEEDTTATASFCVIALGKLGGRELNYSSDIDLMFLYSKNGQTSGPNRTTNKEYFKRVANELTSTLSSYTPAGQCYRLDLRLRPEGSHGELCLSLEAAKEYYSRRARDWELQMLLKARAAAGAESWEKSC